MSGIFISYRREDSAFVSGLLHDRLAEQFGSDAIFTDIDSIPLGVDIQEYIDEQVGQCDIFLAVIGKEWLSLTDDEGRLRLEQPKDFVRLEIESALNRKIPVIPLLVGAATIPSTNELPGPLKKLALRNGTPIRPKPSFDADVERLIRGIDKHLAKQAKVAEEGKGQEERRREGNAAPRSFQTFEVSMETHRGRWKWPLAGVVMAVLVGSVWWLHDAPKEQRAAEPVAQKLKEQRAAEPAAHAGPQEPEMVVIPAGSFLMGSPESEKGRSDNEGPQRRVTIGEFAMARYSVTFDEYDEFAESTARKPPDDSDWGRDRRPVINVSWDDAVAYAAWLAKQTGERYRLPSEAEWEYAARAGTETAYWWSNEIGSNRANCNGCGSEWDNTSAAPVGSFDANSFGLFDTAGNVWEWTQDCWHDSYKDAPTDGAAWETGECSERVIRGGTWGHGPADMRSANRSWGSPVTAFQDLGFRLAQDLD